MKKILILTGLLIMLTACGGGSGKYDTFAQCLSDEGAKMYGAFWCPHCTDQKAEFGPSWDFVNYIECSLPDKQGQTEVCKQAKIESYPTWEFADGERQVGKLSFQQLSVKTGCELPA